MYTRIAIAFALVASSAAADSPGISGKALSTSSTLSTSPPFTYYISYLPDPEEESFLEGLRASPPDLFHLGYQIPFKGALGPTYGHELSTDKILGPDEIPREVARIQRVVEEMRGANVAKLIPYVLTMAFFGHPEKRTDFREFYAAMGYPEKEIEIIMSGWEIAASLGDSLLAMTS